MIYIINVLLIIILGSILYFKDLNNLKKVYIITISIFFILISGLRHIDIGSDTYTYKYLYDISKSMSLSSWLNQSSKDYGYCIFQWICSHILPNYQQYLFLIAIVSISSIGYFIYKNSVQPILSFLIFQSLFFGFFMTGIRQTLAMSLIMFSYEFIKQKNIIKFLMTMSIASTFHKSSLIFIPFYFLCRKKITKKYITGIIIAFPFMFIFKRQILSLMQYIIGYEQYGNYEGAGTYTFTLMFSLITILAILRSKVTLNSDVEVKHYYNALFISLLLIPITYINPSLMRLIMYFEIFIILLIPKILNSFNMKERNLVYYIATVTLLVLYIMKLTPYKFFWQ